MFVSIYNARHKTLDEDLFVDNFFVECPLPSVQALFKVFTGKEAEFSSDS